MPTDLTVVLLFPCVPPVTGGDDAGSYASYQSPDGSQYYASPDSTQYYAQP